MTAFRDATAREAHSHAELEARKDMLPSIVELSRRWTSAGAKGQSITLTGPDLDLLNSVGIGQLIMSAAATEQKKEAIERRALRSLTSPPSQLPAPAVPVADGPTKPDRDMRFSATSGEQLRRERGTVDQPVTALAAVDRRGDSLLRIPEVRRRTGLSTATIHRRGNEKTFPTKVRLGPACVAWYLSDIELFVADPTAYRAE